ncbi:hypothetical protein CF8_3548 [Nocardioides sp. CF8]|nr:hypothetical protein CF8_3548 [Nocardioides sp. CF8]
MGRVEQGSEMHGEDLNVLDIVGIPLSPLFTKVATSPCVTPGVAADPRVRNSTQRSGVSGRRHERALNLHAPAWSFRCAAPGLPGCAVLRRFARHLRPRLRRGLRNSRSERMTRFELATSTLGRSRSTN